MIVTDCFEAGDERADRGTVDRLSDETGVILHAEGVLGVFNDICQFLELRSIYFEDLAILRLYA